MSTVYEETAKIAIAGLCDMKLRIVLSGLILFRDQPKTGADFTAFAKPTRIFQGEDESQGGEMTNTADIPKRFCFWITISAELFYLIVVGIDLMSEGSDMIQDGYERGKKILWDELRYLFMEAGRGAGRQTSASGFDGAAHMVDEHGACSNQDISRTEHSKMCLSFLTSMKDRGEKFGVEAGQAGEIFGVDSVIFARVFVDQT
jgi:hypothetical protein